MAPMSIIDLILIGISLSMDAFAIALCKGLSEKRHSLLHGLVIAFTFGFFQALMPLLGWLLGSAFSGLVSSLGPWIACIILVGIGAKMIMDAIRDSRKKDDGCQACETEGPGFFSPKRLLELMVLGIATSIDAFAVGVTFSFLEVDIWLSIAVIGSTTFAISYLGTLLGKVFGSRLKSTSAYLGGGVLMALGIKMLGEHLLG